MLRGVKPSVYVALRGVPTKALDLLRERCQVDVWEGDKPISKEELLRQVCGKHGIFCGVTNRIDSQLLDAAGSNLKVVASMSVGLDHVDREECRRRKIKVGFTPDVLTSATAELAVALLLATSRRLVEGVKRVTDGTWMSWEPTWMCGQGLDGSTVGIVGLGRIGSTIAKYVTPFGVRRLLYCGNLRKTFAEDRTPPMEFVSFEDLLRVSDFVVASCSLNEGSRRIFDRRAFALMKPSCIFVNVSRGDVVDQEALYEALDKKTIRAAGIDVTTPEPLPTDHPLTTLDNCVILPHIGSATYKSREDMALLTAENLMAALAQRDMPSEAKLS